MLTLALLGILAYFAFVYLGELGLIAVGVLIVVLIFFVALDASARGY